MSPFDDNDAATRLLRLTAYARGSEAVAALGTPVDLGPVRAVARAELELLDIDVRDGRAFGSTLDRVLAVLPEGHAAALRIMAMNVLATDDREEIAALSWAEAADRASASLSAASPSVREAADAVSGPTIRYWRSRPRGDEWDDAYDTLRPDREAAVYVWQALLVMGYRTARSILARASAEPPDLVKLLGAG